MRDVYVGGCRAQTGGLHLGHVYGCFAGIPAGTSLFFVVSDVLGNSEADLEYTLSIVRDATAVARHSGIEVVVARESMLRAITGSLAERLVKHLSYRELAETHPPKRNVKTGGFQGSMTDFLFPLYQAAYLLGLGTTVACYNDDNSRFVDLARKLARRSNRTHGTRFVESTRLINRHPSRLSGWDGQRMAKGNENSLPLTATPEQVSRFCERLVGRISAGSTCFAAEPSTDTEIVFLRSFRPHSVISDSELALGPSRIAMLYDQLNLYFSELDEVRMLASDALHKLIADERSVLTLLQDRLRSVAAIT